MNRRIFVLSVIPVTALQACGGGGEKSASDNTRPTLTATKSVAYGDQILLAGSSNVKIGSAVLAAGAEEGLTVNSINVDFPSASLPVNTLSLRDSATGTTLGSMISTPLANNGFAVNLDIPVGSTKTVDVYAGTYSLASAGTGTVQVEVKASGSGKNSGISVSTAATPLQTMYVRTSIPTFAVIQPGGTLPTTGQALFRFTVSADPAGAIEWAKVNLQITASSGVSVSNLYIVDEANASVNLLDGMTANATGTVPIDLRANTTQALYQQVAAGATKTYAVYATVSGFSSGSTLTISLLGDATPVANAPAATISGNVIWSDRSATYHTITTSDWTNGALLKNFTSASVTYTK